MAPRKQVSHNLDHCTRLDHLLINTARKKWLERHTDRIADYDQHLKFLRDNAPTFKRSADKKLKEWEMMTTNLHVQVRIPDVPWKAWQCN